MINIITYSLSFTELNRIGDGADCHLHAEQFQMDLVFNLFIVMVESSRKGAMETYLNWNAWASKAF